MAFFDHRDPPETKYRNYYECVDCDYLWVDTGKHPDENSNCPFCGATVQPFESDIY